MKTAYAQESNFTAKITVKDQNQMVKLIPHLVFVFSVLAIVEVMWHRLTKMIQPTTNIEIKHKS